MKKTIIVTGGAGYIGSQVVRKLAESGEFLVVIVDNLSTGYQKAVDILKNKFKEEVVLEQVDMLDQEGLNKVFEKYKPEAVIQMAAKLIVDESNRQPLDYFENNVGGVVKVLRAMEKVGCKHIVFSSTAAVYGQTEYLPLDEKHPVDPLNPYGYSKYTSEKLIGYQAKAKEISYVIFRYFNVCGASSDGLLGSMNPKPSHLLPSVVKGAMGLSEFNLTCPTVETADGSPIRDYVNVEDLASAHLLALKYLLNGGASEQINLGTAKGYSVLEIVGAVEKFLGVKIERKRAEPRAGEAPALYTSNEKAKKVLGWIPTKTLEDSIKSLVEWYGKEKK